MRKNAVLAGASTLVLSLCGHAYAQPQPQSTVEEVVVTGSRVVTDGTRAPTPVTTVSTEAILQTTPSNLSDALKTLPQFIGSTGQRNIGLSGSNVSGNTLNLRNFGNQRNLILLDGSRVPPSTNNGVVVVDTLPEMLIQRVDIVTGGASAVYGSDAVSGVVNYITDKNFNGLKFDINGGISTFSDNESYKIGVAAGRRILGDRGHIEGSYGRYDTKGLLHYDDRIYGAEVICAAGSGTVAAPFRLFQNCRSLQGTRGSFILAGPPSVVGLVFKNNGVAEPFLHGSNTTTVGAESGGDGGLLNSGSLLAPLHTDQVFGRFDYDFSDKVKGYLQGSWNRSHAAYPTISNFILGSGTVAFGTILSGNAFLPTSVQSALTAANAPSISIGRRNDVRDGYKPESTDATTTVTLYKAGLTGEFGDGYKWDVNYSRGHSRQYVINIGNQNAEKTAAALDAVRNPVNGNIVCYVSTTQFASRFPDCQPLNPFGPTAPLQSAWDYTRDNTYSNLTNTIDDVNASVSGGVFDLPAGPVVVAISGEYRRMKLQNRSNAEPTSVMDCRGLRANCGLLIPIYAQTITASMNASQNVKEAAIEVNVPVLTGIPFFKQLDVSAAGRYTDYSTSGVAKTWKVGLAWEVSDEFRVRATRSRDIRAPDLFALFSPIATTPSLLNDVHTGIADSVVVQARGNPNLVPEIAQTFTGGVVYRPAWLDRFNISLDYYNIKMSNAITQANGTDQVLQLQCETSGGTSPYCALLVRPLPFSDRSRANFPTRVLAQGINAARQWTHGVDVETNYNFDLADVSEAASGNLAIRLLLSYQPVFNVQTVSGAAIARSAGVVGLPRYRANLGVNYTLDDLSVSVQERWVSGVAPYDKTRIQYDVPRIKSLGYTDVTVSYKLKAKGFDLSPYLSIRNLTNEKPPLTGGGAGNAGLNYAGAPGYDIIGRYFTVGVRGTF